MDFELSDDQEALRAGAQELLEGLAPPLAIRSHLASGHAYDAKLWAAMCEQGWMGVTVGEEQGGLGLGWVEAAVLAEVVGAHTAPAPFVPSLLALDAIVCAGGEASERWTDALVSGTSVGCAAWSRSPSAVRLNDDGSLSGRTDLVIAGAAAEVAVVLTPEAVFAVDLSEVGRPPAQPAMDGTRSIAWLELDRTPATRLGGPEESEDLLNKGAVMYAAEMLGGAGRVLEMTVAYATERVQFGQPIGSFQAVKHRCADMVVDVEGMRSTSWYGAWCLDDASGEEASIAASAAKVWCSDASKRMMASGLQVHGGIGFTWEHDLHLYLKRAQLDQLSFGDAIYHRDRLAGLLRRRVESGRSVV